MPWERASPEFISHELNSKGEYIVNSYRHKKEANMAVEEQLWKVKRRFRIYHLYSDVEPQKFLSCCSRMLANQDILAPYLFSLNVRIADDFQITDDGTLLIKWDFVL